MLKKFQTHTYRTRLHSKFDLNDIRGSKNNDKKQKLFR